MMKLSKKHLMMWDFVLISLLLILTFNMVHGRSTKSDVDDTVLKAGGVPVPPSGPSSCTHIGGGGKKGDSRPCPPSAHP